MSIEERGAGRGDRPGLVPAGRSIERESFRIIDEEMGPHSFPAEEWQVVRRAIHTTGDFDFARVLRCHPLAIVSGVTALRGGSAIVADTRMIEVGLSPWRLTWFGNVVETPARLPESHGIAQMLSVTRSVAAFRHQAQRLEGAVVAIGNAPTALMEVIRLIQEEGVRPALVIGVPVGFVQAEESKERLWRLQDQASIVCLGRKGGSPVAVAVLHALLELARGAAA